MTTAPIADVARELGLAEEHVEPFGRGAAKVALGALGGPARGAGRILLVSAINPTAAGEGKTTVAIALAMAMRRLGRRAVVALRQPSLGPLFGSKGGATGGGQATLVPAASINMHFTGDIHAVVAAHNLLASLVDNALHWRERFGGAELDARRIAWGRVLDSEDRALRRCVIGLGGPPHGVPREERFEIAAASEVMAILALASGQADLEARLGRVVAGHTHEGRAVTALDLGAAPAMAALLEVALRPNLVQTAEGGPALVHAGPFANIAHGCSSVLSTRLGAHLADDVITEAGFGFDLGGEKFLDITCRSAGFWPRAVLLVVTLRALEAHGGLPHLDRHVSAVRAFGLEPIVAINRFAGDEPVAVEALGRALSVRGLAHGECDGFARGGQGALELARTVGAALDATDRDPPRPRLLYELGEPFEEKVRKVARVVYGARDALFTPAARADLARAADLGVERLPVCVAKTHLSLGDDPHAAGRDGPFDVTVREVRVAAGSGMAVALTGDVLTMPGLPRDPGARRLHPGGGA